MILYLCSWWDKCTYGKKKKYINKKSFFLLLTLNFFLFPLLFFFPSFLPSFFPLIFLCLFFSFIFFFVRMECIRYSRFEVCRIAVFLFHFMAVPVCEKSWAPSPCIKSPITPVAIILYLGNYLLENSEFILEDCCLDSSKSRINFLFIVPFSPFSTGVCAALCCVPASHAGLYAVPRGTAGSLQTGLGACFWVGSQDSCETGQGEKKSSVPVLLLTLLI